MTHLDPEARKILSLARAARTPSAADKQRVRSRLALAAAASVAAGSADVAHASHGATGLFGFSSLKLYLAGSALLLLAAAGYTLRSSSMSPGVDASQPTAAGLAGEAEHNAPMLAPEASLAQRAAEAPEMAAQPPAEGVQNAPVASSASSALPPRATSPNGSGTGQRAPGQRSEGASLLAAGAAPPTRAPRGAGLGRELDLLHGAQAAWRARDSERTLRLLDQHARVYPKSELRDERGALRVLALCELGRLREAQQLGQALIRRAPGSPARGAIEDSCAFK